MNWKKRTVNNGELRPGNDGQKVVLNGWVQRNRDLGGLIFVDLRDRWGITQVIVEPENEPELAERARKLRTEYVIWIDGTVRLRSNPNPNIPTGLIEVVASGFGIINSAQLTPFEIDDEAQISEELKLRYRYLDLRRPSVQNKIMLRNKLYQIMHKYFAENDFVEIETPALMRSTPEGARDFLVPSRISKGHFYALPQSPQIFKQILMISGFERYVQIVKCFRDEDVRSDRQAEFTQIDLEMSFIEMDDVLTLMEGFFRRLWKETLDIDIETPFRRMSYNEAMTRYGSDKPDIRFGMEINAITEIVENSEFNVFSGVVNSGGVVAGINAKGCSGYSRKQIDELTDLAKKYGAKGLAWIKIIDGEVNSPIAKFLKEDELKGILGSLNAEDGDLLLISSDSWTRAYTILGALRLEVARREGVLEKVRKQFSFHWVVDFPLFERDEETGDFFSMHHPFTSPLPEDVPLLDTEPDKVRAMAYDVVVNGVELGGGSIRIHENELQQKMFKKLGLSEEQAQSKFGFLLDALKYGAPPHGGIALGLDRVVMSLARTDNIRDVIAFPKTANGMSLMDGSPSDIDAGQLEELGLKIIKKEKETSDK